MQTAVEAKEGLDIQSEGQIINSVTLQHLIRQFGKVSGMTATVRPSQFEFSDLYGLQTVVIPPHRQSIRTDQKDLIYASKKDKERAVIQKIKEIHQSGQPILIGTLSVKESEGLSKELADCGLKSNVLNARNDELEAKFIAEAGQVGAITISTNMAGRGTDIKLGGKDEEHKKKVMNLGGLFVIGTNRHESRRIDRQLRGRAARQGEPGESLFIISFEDALMEKYKFMDIFPRKLHQVNWISPISSKRVFKYIDITQRIIENKLADLRKSLCLYSDILESQRLIIQSERQRVLRGESGNENENVNVNENVNKKVGDKRRSQPTIGSTGRDRLNSKSSKVKEALLFHYDRYWSEHLQVMAEIRDGIYMVQLGGQKPLREFQRRADEEFGILQGKLMNFKKHLDRIVESERWVLLDALHVRRPESTWTYIVSQNPFANQLALLLLDNSNIGFTADPFSAFFLFIKAIMDKRKK